VAGAGFLGLATVSDGWDWGPCWALATGSRIPVSNNASVNITAAFKYFIRPLRELYQ
jgi:hypothetical protein